MKIFNNEFTNSPRWIYWLSLVLFALVIVVVISCKYYSTQKFFENGISQKDIYAKKTIEVVDTKRTELIKRDVAGKIRPVVTPVEDNYIRSNLNGLIQNIEKIRTSDVNYETKVKNLQTLLEIQDQRTERSLLNYILSSNNDNVQNLYGNAKYALDELLKIGVSEADFQQNEIEGYIAAALGDNIKKSQVKPIVGILEHVVLPNLVVDEYATDIARKNAKALVKPYIVTFKKGEKILHVGEPVTQLKKSALEKAGYNMLELNKGSIVGLFFLVCLFIIPLLNYIKKYERRYLNARHLAILGTMTIIITILCAVMSVSGSMLYYLIPIPAYTILIAVFLSPTIAFLATILILTLFSLTFHFDAKLTATFVFAALMASYSVSKINYSKRFDLIKCGIEVGLIAFLAVFLIGLFEGHFEIFTNLETLKPAVICLSNGLLCGIAALGVLPIFENVFKVVTPYALIELADPKSALLDKLLHKAPGTYHHSLMVANLCEAAAEAVGGNPILARVGAFYHDIGKLKRPLFFIENQSYFGIENPHTKLNPRLSKMVITSHTKDGLELAKEYGLPEAVTNFIQQHHGEGLAGHFYNQAVAQEGAENVDEEQFRYPGPKPNSKETAILMLADAVESAVRSLKSPSQEEIEDMINKIITERLNDGQLSDSPLTLKDIKLIATTFNRILRGMQHDRIKYHENILSEFADKDKIRLAPDKDEENAKKIAKKIEEHKEKEDRHD